VRKPEGDWRGLPVYALEFAQADGTNGTNPAPPTPLFECLTCVHSAGTVTRQDQEFWELDALMKKMDRNAPVLEATTEDGVNNYLAAVVDNSKLMASAEFHSFLSLNVTGAPISNICWKYK